MALPSVRFIGAKLGEAIISIAARAKNPRLQPLQGLLYTVAFTEDPDFPAVIKAISEAFEPSGLKVDFMVHDDGPFLTVDPEPGSPSQYEGLKILQKLLRPAIPRTAMVYEAGSSGNRWDIQMSILGGFLSRDEIAAVTRAVAAGNGRVTQIVKSNTQQADVFFITVFARGEEARRGFLIGLQQSCGVFATIQNLA